MSESSRDLPQIRKAEIIDACARLYESKPFKEITLRDIGAQTSFTRTSIYNYFRTKEEIFLALLQREYELWTVDLQTLAESGRALSADIFAVRFAQTVEKRRCLLKLLSMNIYDMEDGSRIENLIEFKAAYKRSLEALDRALAVSFPVMTAEERNEFIYTVYPFLFGVYPYTTATEKQIKAMERAGIDYPRLTIVETVARLAIRLLPSENKEP